jgi:hypothetical protein
LIVFVHFCPMQAKINQNKFWICKLFITIKIITRIRRVICHLYGNGFMLFHYRVPGK